MNWTVYSLVVVKGLLAGNPGLGQGLRRRVAPSFIKMIAFINFSSLYSVSILKRFATQLLGLRWGFETTSNHFVSLPGNGYIVIRSDGNVFLNRQGEGFNIHHTADLCEGA